VNIAKHQKFHFNLLSSIRRQFLTKDSFSSQGDRKSVPESYRHFHSKTYLKNVDQVCSKRKRQSQKKLCPESREFSKVSLFLPGLPSAILTQVEQLSRKDARTSETSIMVFNYSTISTSSISGNSISLDAATKQTMAANKQYIAANATMMSNNLIIVHPPF
jgi:hypothetical protein